MNTRIAAAVAALLIGVAAPASSAFAYYGAPYSAAAPVYGEVETTGSIGAPAGGFYGRTPGFCPQSSAAEGNAAQQNFPVQQYGQTSGGNRC